MACLALAAAAGAFAQTVSLKTGGKQVRIEIGGDATLPANFPQDVALPAAATLVRVQRGGTATSLEFTGSGEPGDVVAELDARMRANGWQQAVVKAPARGHALAWEKDKRAVIAWAVEDDAAPETSDVVAEALAAPGGDAKTGGAGGTAANAHSATANPQRVRIQMQLVSRRGYSPPA
jgi:hypothetical protein